MKKEIKTYNDINHYIDLLLFNIKYNCYVVVELKEQNLKWNIFHKLGNI